jgi:hypothetical protein
VFNDLNRNGLQNPGEPGMSMYVWLQQGGAIHAIAGTDASGRFLFSDLDPGQWTVNVQLLPGFEVLNGPNPVDVEVSVNTRTSLLFAVAAKLTPTPTFTPGPSPTPTYTRTPVPTSTATATVTPTRVPGTRIINGKSSSTRTTTQYGTREGKAGLRYPSKVTTFR